jgi:hypothetical protein
MDARLIIYGLVDPRDGMIHYVGRSSYGLRRPREHAMPSQLRRGDNPAKERWISDLVAGGLRYRIFVLATAETSEALDAIEREWIALGRRSGWPLKNIQDGGDTAPRSPHTPEAREKIRAALTGRKRAPFSAEWRANMSEGRRRAWASGKYSRDMPWMIGNTRNVGRKASAEARAKMSASRIGRAGPCLDGRLRDLSGRLVAAGASTLVKPESGFKGHKHSAESRAKVSKAKLGKPVHTDESKAKISAANTGRKLTEETKAKISLAKIAWHARRKCA